MSSEIWPILHLTKHYEFMLNINDFKGLSVKFLKIEQLLRNVNVFNFKFYYVIITWRPNVISPTKIKINK